MLNSYYPHISCAGLLKAQCDAFFRVEAGELIQQAREVFANTVVARDGFELEVPFASESNSAAGIILA